MVRKVVIMRHGETEWNRSGKQQGQKGSPLTEKGHKQARQVAEIAKTIRIHRLFTSPLDRAMQTANVVSQQINLEPKVDQRLMECSFGLCEGLTRTDIDHQYPGLWAAREKNKWFFRWPEGESYADVYDRVCGFISDCLLSKYKGTTGIIAHETLNKVLIGRLIDLPQQEITRLRHPNTVIFYWQGEKQLCHIDLAEESPRWQIGLIYKSQESRGGGSL